MNFHNINLHFDDSTSTFFNTFCFIKSDSTNRIYDKFEFQNELLETKLNSNFNDDENLTSEKILKISGICCNYEGVFNSSFKQKRHNKEFINKKRIINFVCIKKKSKIDKSNRIKRINDYCFKDLKDNKINISSNSSLKNKLSQEDSNTHSNYNDLIKFTLEKSGPFSSHFYSHKGMAPSYSESSEQKLDKYGIKTFSKNTNQLFKKDNYCSDISSGVIKDNNKLPNLNIKLYKFNYEYFKNNYKEFEQNKFEEPKFISIYEILGNHREEISELWNNQIKIFDDESDLINIVKNGKICGNVINFLTEYYKFNDEKRRFHPDKMINKIKTAFNESIRDYINSFKEMKYKISKLKKNLINNAIKSDFNLNYLRQPLYSILSNDSNESNRKSNYEKILINLNNINKDNSNLMEYLRLKIQDYLDIFRYKLPNIHFKIKLVDYLIKENKKCKDESENKKGDYCLRDYIAALLLLTYNFERFFYLRLKRNFRKA